MKIILLIAIIPFVPFLIVLFKEKKNYSLFKQWFSALLLYLISIIRRSALAYALLLMVVIAACLIVKTLEFSSLMSLGVQLKLFILAWTLSVISIGFKMPIMSNIIEGKDR